MTQAASSPLAISPERAARLMRQATYASISVAVVLIAAKFVAWGMSGIGQHPGYPH